MKYETPELTALTPAINAIQGANKLSTETADTSPTKNEPNFAYQDWE